MATALRLYEATDALNTVREWLDEHTDRLIEAGGDLDALPELRDLIEQAEGDFATKAERVALYIREQVAHAETLKIEAQRLTALQRSAEKAAEWLKTYLCREMRRASQPKIDGNLVKLGVQRNGSPSIGFDPALAMDGMHRLAGEAVSPEGSEESAQLARETYDAASAILTIEMQPVATLNRNALLALWKGEYEGAILRAELEGSVDKYYDLGDPVERDKWAQQVANNHPALRALGIRVELGFHVRIR